MAAVTAMPTTSMLMPPRVSRSPTWMSRLLANPASTTTPPGRTQLPWSSFGWSTGEAVALRPSTSALPVVCPLRSTVQVTGNGPLCAATPGARRQGFERGRVGLVVVPRRRPVRRRWPAPRGFAPPVDGVATTSGPLVAARVRCVGVVCGAVQREPEGQRRRPRGDREQQEKRLGRPVAEVFDAEPVDEEEPAHRDQPPKPGEVGEVASRPAGQSGLLDERAVAHRDQPVGGRGDPLVVRGDDEGEAVGIEGPPTAATPPAWRRCPGCRSARRPARSAVRWPARGRSPRAGAARPTGRKAGARPGPRGRPGPGVAGRGAGPAGASSRPAARETRRSPERSARP